MKLPKLIDNIRVSLGDTLKKIAINQNELSIATGYWDLPGTAEIIDLLKNYKSVRLLIGQEPLAHRYQKIMKLDLNKPDNQFPEEDFKEDLIQNSESDEQILFRETAKKLCALINLGVLKVKVYRKSTLHAKAYIFGNLNSNNSIGIIGSSNFTKAGLSTNVELNALNDNYQIVNFRPTSPTQENGYLTWFNDMWNDPENIDWTGDFKKIIDTSPIGQTTFSPYESYIKTLMEVFPDELIPPQKLEKNIGDVLYAFQNRNAGILINKLEKNGLAILSDSVGLGKTVTAGAVIKHYLNISQRTNILIIAPAALKQQWEDDLSSILNIDIRKGDYQIVSQQDTNAINKIYDDYEKNWRKNNRIDLFVIDEAHNLRSNVGNRHDSILRLLKQHPDSKVLLLTATPINNSLLDIANIIQLASKGKIKSVSVSYKRPGDKNKTTEMLDFFDALKRIQSLIRKTEKQGGNINSLLDEVKPTIHEGLRHYLVRSTRQGIETEGGIIDKTTGIKKTFPQSNVKSIKYKYNNTITNYLYNEIDQQIVNVFEGLDPRKLNLDLLTEFTQQTCHPLDFFSEAINDSSKIYKRFNIKKDLLSVKFILDSPIKNLVPNILQIIFTLGFTAYRPDVYRYTYYGKTVEELSELSNIPERIRIEIAVHNVLQITWLKRMESSAAALMFSVNNYLKRINLFEKYLNKGFIVNLMDANLLETDYNNGEDLEQAFSDYEKYLEEKEKLINEGKDPKELIKQGVEKIKADEKVFNVTQIKKDLERERTIIAFLNKMLEQIIKPENDTKAQHLEEEIKKVLSEGKYGKKVLIFSFFSDTINYLKENANKLFKNINPEFLKYSGFITGQTKCSEDIIQRFSPKSKHYKLRKDDNEINYLFSTDVLSEGQNLQDAGFLVNYDLHWNPVRMIQRNGRINRLGSEYSEVLIENMRPSDELDMYLNLVHRLERKISTIRNTIGLDQGVLANYDVNPIEFIEKYYHAGVLPNEDDSLLAATDEHIVELRKFLGNHPMNSDEFKKVYNIPLGKWNYMSKDTTFKNASIALIRVEGETVKSQIKFSNLFFIDIKHSDEYIATYIDTTKALNYIRTDENDNKSLYDDIQLNRNIVKKRASTEARRQAENVSKDYKLKPHQVNALLLIKPYFNGNKDFFNIDFQGIIEQGVKDIDTQQRLEKVLRKILDDYKKNGSINANTTIEFTNIFNEIQSTVTEERKVNITKGVLFYAKQQ